MSRLARKLLTIHALSVAGGGAAWPSALRDSLVAFWALDEASGTRADSIGSNTLTDNNTVGSDTGLVYAQAADFVAANDEYLSIADNAALSTGDIDFWFAVWIHLHSDVGGIITKDNPSAPDREYSLQIHSTLDNYRFGVSSDGSNYVFAEEPTAAALNTWTLVVVWHDAANDTINLQVDNGTVRSTSHSGGVVDGTNDFMIGAFSPSQAFVDGRIGPAMFGKNYVPTADDRSFLWNDGAGVKL